TFGGWYQDAAFTAPAYDFSAPVTAAMIDPATAVMTLYAKWTVIRYAVTFDSRGGSDVDPITGIPYGNTAAEPNDPMLNSHVFGGWFLDPELTIQWNFNSDTVTKNIILYAKWLSASPPPTGIYPMVFLWTGIASLALFIGFIAAAYRKKYRPLHTKK
ncbi:MAG: InlB B-repeat-containing protein, partial [Oscillospiraceae bacterium]|nr:InlB B-repeat-containing protein [Oscillospiraceae bacterium]